jgi:hypothetical protein
VHAFESVEEDDEFGEGVLVGEYLDEASLLKAGLAPV